MRRVFLCTIFACILLSLVPAQSPSAQAASFSQTIRDPYSVLGPPTVSAAFMNQVLAAAHSPAAGKGQALYSDGVRYGIDPVFALAFFLHESSFGTTGVARFSLSLGNLRCIPDTVCRDGYAWFPTWEAGFEAWYRLILYGYVQGEVTIPLVGHTCTTVAQIVPVYAPAADHNNEAAYISAVEAVVDKWRGIQGPIPGTPTVGGTSSTVTTPPHTAPVDPYRVLGKPTISVDFINQVLAAAHSPAAGKGQALYDDGVRYGVDPAFALAFFMYESAFGTQGLAQITHSLGALQTPITPTCHCQPCLGLRQYHFWEDGFVDWYDLIRNQYVNQWNLSTVDQIVPVYASAGGDEEIKTFIRAVKSIINAWRNGQQPPLITEKHTFAAYTAGNENQHPELIIQLLERIAEMKRDE